MILIGTFIRFLNRFQKSSDLHKEMLAILAAITEVIKERNGTQSSTEFFLGLVSYHICCCLCVNMLKLYSLLTIGQLLDGNIRSNEGRERHHCDRVFVNHGD